ncbi:hypothetical protein DRJ16_03355 [Candidatus Woesearchaeota archaeon]|nr:MAG: hypothetical protein DRJ16_03355 [Candidatus Woesearchaeota archaeon]
MEKKQIKNPSSSGEMITRFSVLDVSAEAIMDVAKLVSSSPHPLTKEDILRSFKKSEKYVSNAISQCVQLNLITPKDNVFLSSEEYRDLIKRSERSQLFLPFRKALQRYPPFLLYVDFISKGYSSEESATMIRGIFRIRSSDRIIEKSFRNWGRYARLIKVEESGKLVIPEAEKGLTPRYVENLLKALRADLQAKIFLIETMSQQAFVYLSEKGIGIENLSNALLNYEKEPKSSANKACQTFEHFMYKYAEDVSANIGKCSGIIEYANAIKSSKGILKNQLHICHSIGALRNMAHHDPDKETGKPWNFTPQGAIISTLIVPTTIRSIYLYWKEKKQEF